MHEPVVNRTNLDAVNMVCLQVDVPLVREVHGGRIWLLAFDEADTDDIPVLVLQEEADALKPAGIPSPTTRTRYATREFFRAVAIGHASCELKLRLQWTGRVWVARTLLRDYPHGTEGWS